MRDGGSVTGLSVCEVVSGGHVWGGGEVVGGVSGAINYVSWRTFLLRLLIDGFAQV